MNLNLTTMEFMTGKMSEALELKLILLEIGIWQNKIEIQVVNIYPAIR
jgi:hypothetical protein